MNGEADQSTECTHYAGLQRGCKISHCIQCHTFSRCVSSISTACAPSVSCVVAHVDCDPITIPSSGSAAQGVTQTAHTRPVPLSVCSVLAESRPAQSTESSLMKHEIYLLNAGCAYSYRDGVHVCGCMGPRVLVHRGVTPASTGRSDRTRSWHKK